MNEPTNTQIRIFNSILSRKHLREHKQDIISEYTNSRTTKTKEMTSEEIQAFIDFHNQTSNWQQPLHIKKKLDFYEDEGQRQSNTMRRKIIAICREAFDMNTEADKADMKRIYACVEKLGYLKKGLNSYSYEELITLVTQFERIGKSVIAANSRKRCKDWKVSVFDDDGNEIEFDVTEFMNKTN